MERIFTRRHAAVAAALVLAVAIAAAGCNTGGGGGAYGATGPNPVTVTRESVTTFYYPTRMAAGTTYPVILWGNGTITQPSWYDGLLRHLASHGFIVAAANTSNAGTGQEMLAGLDNLTAKNGQAGSPFYGRVDLGNVGVTGHSQGGAGAMNAAKDIRVKTAFPIEGPGQPGNPNPAGVHGPVLFMAGQQDTQIAAMSLQAYNLLGEIPGAFAELAGATHLTALGSAGGFRAGATAWASWQLKGDATAKALFVGPGCGYCTNKAMWSRYMANSHLT
jgi:pimeloyl-ACP methyl ester carboxylesterase